MAKSKSNGATESDGGILIVTINRKARSDYEILETLETGISLLGSEVKSIRAGGINLKDSYVRVRDNEGYLLGSHISPYSHSSVDAHDPTRDRKLLLHKRELIKLGVQVQQKGLTLVPLRIYFRNGRCKLEIGVGRGKKHYDKREDIKSREAQRDMERVIRARNTRG